MELYSEGKNYKLYEGSMLDMLEVIEPNTIDSVVTDPPYELNFMNRGWDNSGIAFQKETWEKCFTVLKPGGYLLAFGASRNYHRVACAIEDAGFEIRDTIIWMYGSAMPKGLNVAKAIESRLNDESNSQDINEDSTEDATELTHPESQKWDGWNTQLKPAFEPVIVARKPCEGTNIDNIMKWGVGGYNVKECRIPLNDEDKDGIRVQHRGKRSDDGVFSSTSCGFTSEGDVMSLNEEGRYPSNIILTYDETDKDEVCGEMPVDNGYKPHALYSNIDKYDGYGSSISNRNGEIAGYGDSGSASRYFYCAKASVRDRDEGLHEFESKSGGTYRFREDGSLDGGIPERKNIHPTVKPTSLMQYLVRLVTPKGGTVLDPFNGSGSTGKAVMYENADRVADYNYIGIELTHDYLPIADARIAYVNKTAKHKFFSW